VKPSHPHEVRIVGGAWKRSKLPVLDRPGLRPTPDRVRETLFNWLGQDLTGWRVLDVFAGSGALGFEAASRGAAEVVLLETDRAAAEGLERSRVRLGGATMRIQRTEALAWMAASPPACFDLVLLDPPFGAGLHARALEAATRLVVPGGFVYLESDRPWPPEEAPGLHLHRSGHAGAVHFQLWRAG
jgi:16S rRNA (guanine(966)-N(2))-methyltransferase RsmD